MAVATTTTPRLRHSSRGWVSSPRWDLFWMFSALWGSALCYAVGVQVGHSRAGAVLFVANTLLAVCHSWSTTYVVLGSPLLAEARRRNRLKFTVVPIAVVLGSLALGVAIGLTGSLPNRFPLGAEHALWALYLALFWVGHFWHFGNQDFGVLSIYRLKAGQNSLRERRVDKAYAVAMMFVIQPIVYLKSVSHSPLSEAVRSYVPIPAETVAALSAWAVLAAIALTLAIGVYELRKPRPSTPKLLYYLVMLSHPVVLDLVHWRLGFFYLIVYFWSHWFIAIGLVGRINTNYYRGTGLTPAAALLRHATRLGLFVGAAYLFYREFGLYSVFSGSNYKEVLSAVWPEWAGVVGLVLGAFLAEQLLHYYCDRCLFRLRDPDVRRAVAPLL